MGPKSSSVRATASKTAYRSLIEKASTSMLNEETPGENAHEVARLEVPVLEAAARRAVSEELRRSELLHRTLTANLPDTSMFLLDRDLRILIAEGQGVRQLPWIDENMFRGRTVDDLQGELPNEVLAMSLETYHAALAGKRGEFEFSSDGMTFTVTAVPIRGDDGQVESALAVVRDVTQRKAAEEQLGEHASQQECVARLGELALRERDLHTLLNQAVAAVAQTLHLEFCEVLALRRGDEMLDFMASVGFPEGDRRRREIPNRSSSYAGYVLRGRDPVVVDDLNTETRFDRTRLLLDHGVVSGMSVLINARERPFGVLSAHTSHRRHFGTDDVNFLTAVANLLSAAVDRNGEEETSRHAALHDPLTGLPNRTLALDRLAHALDRRRRDGTDVATLLLDLDRFKVINDSLGHGAGDELLLALAPRLREIMRAQDTVARLSGDEFAIVCEAPDGLRQVVAVAERVAAAVGRPFALNSGKHFMTTSIGISVATGAEDTPESLLRDADVAMYRAKRRGPGRYEIFDDNMRSEVLARLRIEAELRRALDNRELRVHYQPIIDTRGGQPTALEALVRWEHPRRGLIAPLDFIPIAEETGLIIELGRWVLEQACQQGAAWQRHFGVPLKMFVNASGRQIADPQFAADVAEIAQRSGLGPGTLGLEVTESVFIEEAGSTLAVLTELVEGGVRLVLDDFGTGYSSLSYLKQFPLDGLKIDRAFTKGLGRSPADTAIVKAVIDMSRALGLTVVAEGVETQEQLEQLRLLACPRAQGYLFSRAQQAKAMGEYLGALLGEATA
jgi:diguanylate cyclase (GGDEF)-like protein/PAS domain S-box-containing protein